MAFIDVPNFPTESLHKFRAIVGLIMMFGGFIYLLNEVSAIRENLIEINTKVDILEIKKAYLKTNADVEAFKITANQLVGEANRGQFLCVKLLVILVFNSIVSYYGFIIARHGFRKWEEIQEVIDTSLKRDSESKAA